MLSWLIHAWKLIHKCKWSWWQEVEVIKLVNEIMRQILHPVSTRAFVAGLLETMGLLMLLVKMERNDVLAGLSKAVVAFYDAVLGFEKVAVCCSVLQCVFSTRSLAWNIAHVVVSCCVRVWCVAVTI